MDYEARYKAQQETLERLANTHREYARLKAERDRLITELIATGASMQAIATAAQLTSPAITYRKKSWLEAQESPEPPALD
jgi:hypothetical protein